MERNEKLKRERLRKVLSEGASHTRSNKEVAGSDSPALRVPAGQRRKPCCILLLFRPMRKRRPGARQRPATQKRATQHRKGKPGSREARKRNFAPMLRAFVLVRLS